MNKVILTGRLTRDSEQRMTQTGLEIARFSLAVQNDFVSKTGERTAEFINCVAFGNSASAINKYCRKGSMIGIQGRIRNSSYDAQDGTKRYTTEVIVEQFEFLGSKSNNGGTNEFNSSNNYQQNDMSSGMETTNVSEDPYKNFGDEVTLDTEDLPF